jgi:multidrug transporter EmrE-like cation transporter
VDQVGGIGGVMKKKIGWGILGTVATSIISLVVYAAPAWELEILGVYVVVVGLITLGLYLAID